MSDKLVINNGSGSGNGSFTIAAKNSNTTGQNITHLITVTNGDGREETVTFVQLFKPSVAALSQFSWDAYTAGESIQVQVNAPGDWYVSDDWGLEGLFELDKKIGVGNDIITVTALTDTVDTTIYQGFNIVFGKLGDSNPPTQAVNIQQNKANISINANPNEVNIQVNESEQINPQCRATNGNGTPLPLNDTYKIVYTSNAVETATVDENGVVTGVSEGTTSITVAYKKGNKTLASTQIPVYVSALPVYSVTKTVPSTVDLEDNLEDNGVNGVTEGEEYSATLTFDEHYDYDLTVTMGDEDITDNVFDGTGIHIDEVTGDVVITITDTPKNYNVTITKDSGVTSTDNASSVTYGDRYSNTFTAPTGYEIDTIESNQGTVSGNTITIRSVTGDIVITVTIKKSLFTVTDAIKNELINNGGAVEVEHNYKDAYPFDVNANGQWTVSVTN